MEWSGPRGGSVIRVRRSGVRLSEIDLALIPWIKETRKFWTNMLESLLGQITLDVNNFHADD